MKNNHLKTYFHDVAKNHKVHKNQTTNTKYNQKGFLLLIFKSFYSLIHKKKIAF